MVTAPFGAVKDVTILSGIAGNSITLVMIAVVLLWGSDLLTNPDYQRIARGAVIIFFLSAPFVIFSKRVFSLPARELWRALNIHFLRLAIESLCLALAWHYAMPDVGVGDWLFLVAARMLVFRLPLVPNKDLLFANFAIIFIGQGEALGDMIAFAAALTLMVHIVLASVFGLYALMRKSE